MKIFLDTNVWLRFILGDNEEIFSQCKALFEQIEVGGLNPYTSTIVLLEVYFVLTSTYKINKKSVIQDIKDILNTRNIVIIEKTNFKNAFNLHLKTEIKLANCLIAAQVSEGMILCSFDKDFKKVKNLLLKTPKEITND